LSIIPVREREGAFLEEGLFFTFEIIDN
jgi:hypothetical protein